MSINLTLCRFLKNTTNEITEDKVEILSTTISIEKIEKILTDTHSKINKLIFEKESNEKYEIQIIDTNKIPELLSRIENEIDIMIKKNEKNSLSKKEKDQFYNQLRIILNFRNMLLEKFEEYKNESNVLITIG